MEELEIRKNMSRFTKNDLNNISILMRQKNISKEDLSNINVYALKVFFVDKIDLSAEDNEWPKVAVFEKYPDEARLFIR